jgi:hypothetical protein
MAANRPSGPRADEQTYSPTNSDVGKRLACKITVTYVLPDVTLSASSSRVTVIPAMRENAEDLRPPQLCE